jgi:hypothetical protein
MKTDNPGDVAPPLISLPGSEAGFFRKCGNSGNSCLETRIIKAEANLTPFEQQVIAEAN